MAYFYDSNQQNVQTCSLDIYITIWHWVFLHATVHVGTPGNQTAVIQHKTKLVAFVHSRRGVKDSDG
jgi:hypothetical protein